MASRGSLHDVVAALCLAALTALASPAWAQVPELPPGVDISDLDPNDLPPGVDITDLDPNDLPPGVDVPPGLVPTGDASGGGDGTTPPADGDEVIAQGAPDPESEPTPDPAPETPESGPTTGAGTQPASPTSGGGGGTTTANAPRPARPIVTLSRDAVLGGELSWLYSELKQRLAAEGIVLDDEGHQVNLDPSVVMISSSKVDELPGEWYAIMAEIAAERGFGSVEGDTPYLVAAPGASGILAAAEAERAAAEQAAADAAQQAASGGGGSGGGSGGSPQAPGGGGDGTGGSDGGEDVPDLGGDGTGDGEGADDGDTGQDDGGGDDPAPGATVTPEDLGVTLPNDMTAAERQTVIDALGFIPVNALKGAGNQGVEIRFPPDPGEEGLLGLYTPSPPSSGNPPTVDTFPLAFDINDNQNTLVHELAHHITISTMFNGATGEDGVDRIMAVFNSLSAEEKEAAIPSGYAADNANNPDGGPEVAAEIMAYYLQNYRTETGDRENYRDRPPPQAVVDLMEDIIQELGGLPGGVEIP